MIDREHTLPQTAQAALLDLSRGCVYYRQRPVPQADLEIMRQIDGLHLEYPFAGARMLRTLLRPFGIRIGRRHVKTLTRLAGIEALYRKKSTSRRNPQHPVFPYLLRSMVIDRPNQVWAGDLSVLQQHGRRLAMM